MRLIDADKLILYLNDFMLQQSPIDVQDIESIKVSAVIKDCIKAVDEQPTAYDVNKVIQTINNKIKTLDAKQTVFMEYGLFSAADAKASQIARYVECREIVESSGCGEIDNDGWILCNERLPETFEPKAKAYLTTNEDGMIGVSYYHHMCGWSNGYESVFDVIAWQPLPEPYREEK